ncbi:MAG: AAA family ATPase [Planctomycetota bacterium]
MSAQPYLPVDFRRPRIVITGGPGGGKTTIAGVLRRQLADRLAVVPESATILFSGGFPRSREPRVVRAIQSAIFAVQRQLEEVHSLLEPARAQVCDRGTLDGAAFWPDGLDSYLAAMGTDRATEFARYHAVIFLRSAAHDGKRNYDTENPCRIETPAEACALDDRLFEIWRHHPRFQVVRSEANFYEKVAAVLIAIDRYLDETEAAR